MTCSALINIGNANFKSGASSPTICPPYAITAFIPQNCCNAAKWIAIMTAALGVDGDLAKFSSPPEWLFSTTYCPPISLFNWLYTLPMSDFIYRITESTY